jgi:tetratricopeptide (TPR) repeat protein
MPLCFVLMPFGTKTGPDGRTINFDTVYEQLIKPAIAAAGLEPIRADHEEAGGFIQKPMFEALLLCEFAVADLTNANPNVFYELGIRHAVRPWSTVPIMAEGGRLPIDVDALKTVFYQIGSDGAPAPDKLETTRNVIGGMLREARSGGIKDSPIYQLIDYYPQPQLDHEKADIFRTRVKYSQEVKDRLAEARQQNVEALVTIEEELGSIEDLESGVVIDLMLSYRSRKAFKQMTLLVEKMSTTLRQTVMVQEQYALALNREKQPAKAERVLLELIKKRGPSSETYGILGRVYKDQWEEALKAGDELLAQGILEKAIGAYLKGFEADWRDSYPGVNAVTLMELHDPPDPRRFELIPVVRYSVERRISKGTPDYWDYATLLELATLAGDQQRAFAALTSSLAALREIFEADTTARNLRLIVEAKSRRGELLPWMEKVVQKLAERAKA